jgi:3-deoxy-D-manno-octulosonic-acid transferase
MASLWLYRAVLWLALPIAIPLLLLRDRLTGKRRPPFSDRLACALPELPDGGVWIHAVSVGEVELARRLIRELTARGRELPLLVTATTATGLELARKTLSAAARVVPAPLDLPGPIGRVLDAARPRLLVLVETELWPELLHQAGRRDIPVAIVNGRLSEGSSAGYRRVRWLLGPLLEPLSKVLVRDRSDAVRFAAIGVSEPKIDVAGNVKYDLEADPTPLEWSDSLARIARGRPVVVAGSTMEGEEAMVLDAVVHAAPSTGPVFVVLAPRHPERFQAVARMLAERGLDFARRSTLADSAHPERCDVLLLDTIGELARVYRHGAVAFIGGSLVPTGGHNPLEAAVWGVPVLSGPHVFNFREVYDEMTAAGAVRLVADAEALADALAAWLTDPPSAAAAGRAGRAVVEANRGATARTADALLALIDRHEVGP